MHAHVHTRMKTHRISLLFFSWLFALSALAQSVEITQSFRKLEAVSVLTIYKNEFGHYENRLLDRPFPYAVIRVEMDDTMDQYAVAQAKEYLTLNLGAMFKVKEIHTEKSNQILFLVPAGISNVSIDCGDGCSPVTIFTSGKPLEDNTVYVGQVHYTPARHIPTPDPKPIDKKRQFFTFTITPDDAVLEVLENGVNEIWPVVDGVAVKVLDHGTYQYTISANRYHTEKGVFTVSDAETEKTITLRPQFGWLTIKGTTIDGAYVYATNTITNASQSLGVAPVINRELDAGTYTLLIKQDKYKDYTTTITITDNKTTTITPSLVANFAQVTLTTAQGAGIWLDDRLLGTTSWTGPLEFGEHSIETRQDNHRTVYTTVRITPQSIGQSITLNNPLPIYGTLLLNGTPAGATIYIDGKQMGKTPRVVNDLLIGQHNVTIQKDGFAKYEQTVMIHEGQEQTMRYTLVTASSSSSSSSSDAYAYTPSSIPDATLEEWYAKGDVYYYGNDGFAQDYTEAAKWYRKAALQGHAGAQNQLGECYYYGNGVSKDFYEAVKWYRKSAEQGNSYSQYSLGWCYEHGEGVEINITEAKVWYQKAVEQGSTSAQKQLDALGASSVSSSTIEEWYSKGDAYYYGNDGFAQDYTEAAKWYRKAAVQGHAGAQCDLGICYEFGYGVSENKAEAVIWYRKSADQGYARAQCNLAWCYEAGIGVTEDISEAVKWYRKSADQGLARAQNNLGDCYYEGRGVFTDYYEAVSLYRKSAEQGNKDAQYSLAWCYEHGEGISENKAEAVKWYRKSAEQGNRSAQYSLAKCYKNGEGISENKYEAVKWYRKSAEQGHGSAQNDLGWCYEQGVGVTQDYYEAVKWYRKSAEQGNARAQNNLGECYYFGKGVSKDFHEAVKWYRKAADQDNKNAQYSLGWCYEHGEGVSTSISEAKKWYRLAADQGHEDAKKRLNNL